MPPVNQEQKARHMLTLIAIGLLQLEESVGAGTPLIPLNTNLKQGWEELCFLCFQSGAMPPRSIPELVKWLHLPIRVWAVIGDLLTTSEYEHPLLNDEATSQLCYQLAEPFLDAYDVRLELEDEYFVRIQNLCRQLGDADTYSRAREYICLHPIIEDYYAAFAPDANNWRDDIRHLIEDCYENIPPDARFGGKNDQYILICPFCGWTLQQHKRELICGESCTQIYGDLAQDARKLSYIEGMARTREGVQRSVVSPEIELIKLADQLRSMWGVNVTLYPQIDAYDLLIEFVNGRRWAVDMKDHRRAVRLARNLQTFRYSPPWNRAFYVFPDYRADADGYLEEFGNYWIPQKDVTFMGVRAFLKLVRHEAEK